MLFRINKGYIQWTIELFRCLMVVIDENVLLLAAYILLGVSKYVFLSFSWAAAILSFRRLRRIRCFC